MPSIQRISPREKVRQMVVKFDGEDGSVIEVRLGYYPGRISTAPVDLSLPEDIDQDDLTDAEFDALKSASTLCHYVDSWDLEGPLYNNSTNVELVSSGQVIPLDPRIVQHIDVLVTGTLYTKIGEHVLPNASKSRNERRRSR